MKQGYQNLHTHTTYCDGKLSVEDMVVAAINKGGSSIGFSEHSFVPFDPDYSMTLADTPTYMTEVKMLKEKYIDQIDVFLGLEVDYFTDEMPMGLDYIIGAAHHIQKGGEYITIDATPERLEVARDMHFSGDFYSLIEVYFETVSEMPRKTKADIIAHFDLIKKHNEGGRLFDETHPRYIDAALGAMKRIVGTCNLFEISSGAMFRMGKTEQYPSTLLLKELKNLGGEILFASDSHCAESLYFKFDEMQQLAESCGFTYIKRLTENGFIDVKI
ncbi:MAG: histidinol-phosphatase [Oscillospiraceae bacterium]|nr:histidinol-phosphatase [Oscillospiraceae bacterium]MCL2279898.1 histidinol-phosphatase [Oscillospiraceae bacterium]